MPLTTCTRPRPETTAHHLARWAWVPLALALVAAVAAGTPRLALTLAGPTPARAGTLTPVWTVPAAFVHPGSAVVLPEAGRLLALQGPGLVAAGVPLVAYAPQPSAPPLPARALRRAAPPARRGGTRGPLLCLRRGCSAGGGGPAPPVPTAAAIHAVAAGWFVPGWDPLAALLPAAYTDLPPWAVLSEPARAAPAGALLPSGLPIGDLGDPWQGYWLCVLPTSARLALGQAAAAEITWPGGGSMAVRPVGTGPDVAGYVVGIFAADAPGGDPGPPARTTARLRLAPVSGAIVPATALWSDGAPGRARLVELSAHEPPRVLPVTVLAVVGSRAAVTGVPAGSRVLARPGAPWRRHVVAQVPPLPPAAATPAGPAT